MKSMKKKRGWTGQFCRDVTPAEARQVEGSGPAGGKYGRWRGGSWMAALDPNQGEWIGAAVEMRDRMQPVSVSPGNRVSLQRTIRMTPAMSDGFRVRGRRSSPIGFPGRCTDAW
jgi:hypothetical protein